MMPVWIDYTNHRGERRSRYIRPQMIVFKSSPWHPGGPQWILEAADLSTPGEPIKDFAMSGIHGWKEISHNDSDGIQLRPSLR